MEEILIRLQENERSMLIRRTEILFSHLHFNVGKAFVTFGTSVAFSSISDAVLDRFTNEEAVSKHVEAEMRKRGQYVDGSTKTKKSDLEDLLSKLRSRLNDVTPGTEGYRKLEKRIANVEDRLENILPKAIESAEKVKSKWGNDTRIERKCCFYNRR